MVLRKCKGCGIEATHERDLGIFVTSKNGKYGKALTCKVCWNIAQRKSPVGEDIRRPKGFFIDTVEQKLFYKYGIRYREYFTMFTKQKGLCAICNSGPEHERNGGHKHLAVDHCHARNTVRSLLCMKCNVALGLVEESLPILDKMKAYLVSADKYRPIKIIRWATTI